MSERYSKLFALPENLYAEGAPLVIAAGALLKDNQTGKVLAQLKFRSISPQGIEAIKVKITPLDTAAHPLGEAVEYQYLDFHARRSEEFGQKSPIALPDANTRSFSVSVCEIVFTDISVWQSSGEPWEPLKKPISISAAISDYELRKQVKLEYGNSFEYIPTNDKDLWICSCGELNRKGEDTCVRCRQELSRLLSMDMGDLKAKRDARLAAEKVQAEKDAAQAKARAKKNKKLAVILTPIVVVAIVAAVLVSGMVKKSSDYNNAQRLLETGEYDKAIAAFEALGDYKDSSDCVERAKDEKFIAAQYSYAMEQVESGEYSYAISGMEKIKDYADGQQYIDSVKSMIYEKAIEKLNAGNNREAKKAFEALADYKDSAEYLRHFAYRLTERTDKYPAMNDTVKYEYDDVGNLVIPTKYIIGGMNVEANYNDEGLLIRERKTVENTSSDKSFKYFFDYISQFTYEYDQDGKIIKQNETTIHGEDALSGETNYIGVVTYEYNSAGLVTKKTEQGTHFENNREKEYTSYTAYTYDKDGLLISATQYTKDGRKIISATKKVSEVTVEIDYDYTLVYLPDAEPVDYQLLIMNDFLDPYN